MKNPFLNDTADIFKRMISNWRNSNNFCSIAKVVAINSDPISVDIQPLIKYFDNVVKWRDYPLLSEVPVVQLASNFHSIKTPLNVGDTGIVLWMDREIYTCLLSGAQTSTIPDSGDLNDLNACVFIPFLQSFSLAKSLKSTGVDIVSLEVSLMTQLLNLLTDMTSLLTNLTTFSTAIISAGAPYAGAPTMPVVGDYPIALSAGATALNSSIATLSIQISAISTMLTIFKGAQ